MDDIAVVDRDPRIFYVGYATGGVWKTENNGTTFEPIFETYGSASIGAVAVCQSDPNLVWVGTGEANGRNNSGFGDGVYKSTDGGRTFAKVGLRETQTIQRIVIDPRNPDVVYVAAVGNLYGPNPERGVFKTTDGGRTWSRVLFVDDDTGVIEIVFDPSDPDLVYAATYQRRRTAWGFHGGGPGSGIWKSEDAGAHWQQLTGNGLPSGPKGRIGLAIAPSDPNVLYAQIEVLREEARIVDPNRATTTTRPEPGTDNAGGVWRSTDKGATWEFRSDHNVRPQYYSELLVDPKDENV
ncbi:MAG: WD40/YVTN/BNR-like repeat-containing protein, partial [Planctomycetota bacterium]